MAQAKAFIEVFEIAFWDASKGFVRHETGRKAYIDLMSIIALYSTQGDSQGYNCMVYMPQRVMYLKETYEQMKKALF